MQIKLDWYDDDDDSLTKMFLDQGTERAQQQKDQEQNDYMLALELSRDLSDVSFAESSESPSCQSDQSSNQKQTQKATDKQIQEENDAALAMSLQETLIKGVVLREEQLMQNTAQGKAWKFVEAVLAMHDDICRETLYGVERLGISTIAADEMVYTIERMFLQQQDFRAADKPCHVDIGYHYTEEENLYCIRSAGLLTAAEREQANIPSMRFKGSVYGDGIYTCSNPYSFHEAYGERGIFVARLRGKCLDPRANNMLTVTKKKKKKPVVTSGGKTTVSVDVEFKSKDEDSCVIDQETGDETVVLRKSSQCVALMRFKSDIVRPSANHCAGNAVIFSYHCKLQFIIDKYFNGGVSTPITATGINPITVLPPANAKTSRRMVLAAAASQCKSAVALPHCSSSGNAAVTMRPYFPVARTFMVTSIPGTNTMAETSKNGTVVYHAPNKLPHAARPQKQHGKRASRFSLPLKNPSRRLFNESKFSGDSCRLCLRTNHTYGDNDTVCPNAANKILACCGHKFHMDCLLQVLQKQGDNTCPICNNKSISNAKYHDREGSSARNHKFVIGSLTGTMPSGTMTVGMTSSIFCAGYEQSVSESAGRRPFTTVDTAFTTIVIVYNIPAAVQKPYHKNPGRWHSGTQRTAFLPFTDEGSNLLKRLVSAFSHGLTFTIGKSESSGLDDGKLSKLLKF